MIDDTKTDNRQPLPDPAPSTVIVQELPEKEIIARRKELADIQTRVEQAELNKQEIIEMLKPLRAKIEESKTMPINPKNTFLQCIGEIDDFITGKTEQAPSTK